MRLSVLRCLAGATIAFLGTASISATPAFAAGCKDTMVRGLCVPPSNVVRVKNARRDVRHTRRGARRARLAHRHGRVRHHRRVRVSHVIPNRGCDCKWYGWAESRHGPVFYHEGRRYRGGTPHGAAGWHNNWESGFNVEVFWLMAQRQLP